MSALRPFSWRDRLARRLVHLSLRLAHREYRAFIGGAIRYGMDAAARDAREGRDLPLPWDATSDDDELHPGFNCLVCGEDHPDSLRHQRPSVSGDGAAAPASADSAVQP